VNKEFERAYEALNAKQRRAVESIEGPVLVIAGPGTGKTQLLTTRVGFILQNTDTLPQNILCLTFTEAGVLAMRERLQQFLGQAAYDITISTYHAFGSDLLRRYPQYADSYGSEPIDELGSDALIREILAGVSYENPLKSAETYAADLRAFMSECKKALLSPAAVRGVAKANLSYIAGSAPAVSTALEGFKRIDRTAPAFFEQLSGELKAIKSKKPASTHGLKEQAIGSLEEALSESSEKNTKPLTAWKNQWLEKDADGKFILAGRQKNEKLLAAAEVYELYQKQLAARKLFDYDDMILRAIKALEAYPELKYTLAEQYQYVLLDEFQDTNPAQFKIVELLTDSPVNEGRPNVMAVGDDDQAIYAFQGADHANMRHFASLYRGVEVISLRENYRSTHEILDVAYNLSSQIQERLHEQFAGITKILKAASPQITSKAEVSHSEFVSDGAQYSWVAEKAAKLVKKGVEPQEIAILAPRHRYLIPILPYLADQGLAVRYEKRENVLDKPVVRMLEQMSRLVLALGDRDRAVLDGLWPEVLSYDFWQLPTKLIWQISWEANDTRSDWTTLLAKNNHTKDIAEFFLRTKDLLTTTTLEQQLDILTGVSDEDVKDHKLPLRCPFYEYHFGKGVDKNTLFLEHLSDLAVLRGRLRAWRRDEDSPFSLRDFSKFIAQHRAAGINILSTSPHYESSQAVNVMTAYQSKGREFKAVFILAALDEVWGAASRTAGSNISLPPNLEFIRYQGASDDERLRLLYVAITRAKSHLYLTSYATTMDGKNMRALKYLIGKPGLEPVAAIQTAQELSPRDMQNYWHLRHLPPFKPQLIDLLEPQLENYQLSPTHLNQFTDVTSGGPQQFFLNTILRFPKGQGLNAQFGTAVHNTIKWVHDTGAKNAELPDEEKTLSYFNEQLRAQRLVAADHDLLLERGFRVITAHLKREAASFDPDSPHEVNFRGEGVFVGDAHLSGKIDKLILDKKTRLATVVDFKTGKASKQWATNVVKLHKYRQQLLMYKLLIEGSHSYTGWKVDIGLLEFVEPTPSGEVESLELSFDKGELERLKLLTQAVWKRIKALDFPDTQAYSSDVKGIRKFENDLLAK